MKTYQVFEKNGRRRIQFFLEEKWIVTEWLLPKNRFYIHVQSFLKEREFVEVEEKDLSLIRADASLLEDPSLALRFLFG